MSPPAGPRRGLALAALLLAGAAPGPAGAADGAALFEEKCGMCHRSGGMGTGLLARRLPGEQALLENRRELTAEYIAVVIRTGLGNMPRISRAEVSDAQLADINAYLARGDRP